MSRASVPPVHHSPSPLTLIRCHGSPQSSEVPLHLSLVVPHLLVVVLFIVGGPHRLFVAPLVCCGGPPFVHHGFVLMC
jgi:hypothetical protein